MKMYALIAFDAPDDRSEDFSKEFNLAGNNVENYEILRIIPKEDITFDSFRFPHKLRNLLIINGIKKVTDLEQCTFQWLVRLFIRNGIDDRQRTAYLECIINMLKILGLYLSQNGEVNLKRDV